MLRTLRRSVMGAAGLALLLAGCSPTPLLEGLPASVGGLPSDAPARPATPHTYPAVHDMPPPRATKPMTDEEQAKAEKDLRAAGDRTTGRREPGDGVDPDAPKKGTPAAKKKPKAGKDGGTDSANTGAKTNP
jgi:hypothetical protein